jgi:hypothetical protein
MNYRQIALEEALAGLKALCHNTLLESERLLRQALITIEYAKEQEFGEGRTQVVDMRCPLIHDTKETL